MTRPSSYPYVRYDSRVLLGLGCAAVRAVLRDPCHIIPQALYRPHADVHHPNPSEVTTALPTSS